MKEIQMEGGVYYTDGGKRPLGVGWGVHGYTYSIDGKEIKAPRNKNQATDHGYLDKTINIVKHDKSGNAIVTEQVKPFSENPVSEEVDKKLATTPIKKEPFFFKSTKARPVKPETYVDAWGSLGTEVSNNVAELTALKYALDLAETKALKKVKIISDSEYSILGTVNARKWQTNKWTNSRGLPVSNKELWQQTLKAIGDAALAGREVQFVWVRAHNGEHGNEKSDTNATKGVVLNTLDPSEKTIIQEHEAKTYDKSSYEYSRLLAFPTWFFKTNNGTAIEREDGTFQYYVGSHNNAPEMTGKRAIDHNYGVVRLKERVPVFDEIVKTQETILSSTEETICFGIMANIFKQEALVELEVNGGTYFYPREDSFNRDLVLFDKLTNGGLQLTHVARPPRIAGRVFDYCNLLDYVLDQYLNKDKSVCVTDVTDVVQHTETDKKGKVKYSLQEAVKSNLGMVGIEVNHNLKPDGKKKFNIAVGFTIPSKNHLSRLIGKDFKLEILTWRECDIAFRYAAVVTSADGIAIYATHSNSVICKKE